MATVIDATYYHMPDWADYKAEEGATVRTVLKHLREVGRKNFGDIGSCDITLSDGSFIAVENRATEGGLVMCAQRIVRYDKEIRPVRVYAWY
jgi:hypothetical protein